MTILAQLTIEIKGTEYGAQISGDGREIVLEKGDGTAYTVTEGIERTTCTCPDWEKRHADLPYSDGCKHIRALTSARLIRNVSPGLAPQCTRAAEETARDEIDNSIDAQIEAQGLVNADWFMNTGERAGAPRVSDLGCVRGDGTIDHEAMWDGLRAARERHEQGVRIRRTWGQSFGTTEGAPSVEELGCVRPDGTVDHRGLVVGLYTMMGTRLTGMHGFRLDGSPEAPAKLGLDRVAMAKRLLATPVWTARRYSLADRLEDRLEKLDTDEGWGLYSDLQAARKEYRRILDYKRLPTTEELGAVFGATARPVAPQGHAVAKPGGKRGRPAKYTHIDWETIAQRMDAGETRRKLAEELGIPANTIAENAKKFRAIAV